jgi:type 1 glutamine amidotransferase
MIVTRRTMIAGTAATASLAPARAATSGDLSPRQTKNRHRALALIGDRYHNADYIRVSLDPVFRDLGIDIDYTIDTASISAGLLKPYQLFLILRDGMLWPGGYSGPDAYVAYEPNLENNDFPAAKSVMWMTEDQGKAIADFVSAGGGFYPLHNSSHISLSSKNYRAVMGGAYIGHPPLRPFEVHATANAHPITAGMKPFMVNDEQHYVEYDKDPKYVILESENRDGLTYETGGRQLGTKSPAGWAYDYGRGRVVFTAVGHTIHAMWNPQYLELQRRSVRWLLKDI